MKNQSIRRSVYGAVARLLLPGQVLLGVPVQASAQEPALKEETQAPAPPPVTVERKAPKTDSVPAFAAFSANPTDDEIFRARVFGEPLVPLGTTTPAENRALAEALTAYLRRGRSDDLGGLRAFLAAHPQTAWRASLQLNLGITCRRTGYFTRALQAWEDAWQRSKEAVDPRGRAVADRAVAELADLNARLGRFDVLETLLGEVSGRDVGGSAGEKLTTSRRGLWLMQNRPGEAFRCGPLALDRILALRPGYEPHPLIAQAQSTTRGTSLAQMKDLASRVDLPMRMAFRERGAAVVVPALVHWRAGHFAALVREAEGRYLMQDPTFGDEVWLTVRALEDEGTGYFLVPEGPLPAGWRAVPEAEGGEVWGRGAPDLSNPEKITYCQQTKGSGGCTQGSCAKRMADYTFFEMLASLRITDAPVGYSPPRGPSLEFVVSYNQRDVFQPQIFSYSNLGPKWTFDWMSYLEDDPANPAGTAYLYARGGGRETYSNYDPGTQSYPAHYDSHATVHRTSSSPIRYERRLPDGSVEVFAQADGAASFPRRVFLTEWRDPQGNAVTFTYDASLRLVAATDPLNQVTQVLYENPDPLKITKVRDPFGRFATFEYDASGRLIRITDVIGIVSEFAYGAADFINSLTTPYGTTLFAKGENGLNRWLQAIDPLGGTERLEYMNSGAPIPASDPPATVPLGFTNHNIFLGEAVSFFWDKRAMALAPGDYTKAQATHWLQTNLSHMTSGTKRAEKMPLENRVWYAYPGQSALGRYEGTGNSPSKIARVLDDGAAQVYQYEYNAKGRKIREIDPVGRETVYVYGTASTPDPDPANGTGIDLLEVKRKNSASAGGWDLLQGFTYDAQHQALTSNDASGQTTTRTYLPDGRLQMVVTPPRNGLQPGESTPRPLTAAERTTTYTYYPDNAPTGAGRIQTITEPSTPQGSPATTYSYDGHGRVRTQSDSDNYTLTHDYDALDRLTRTTYPDGTYKETVYSRLDAEKQRDRHGRWTHVFHDALRRVVAARDALGQTYTLGWCNCGSLEKLTNPKGNAIAWEYDLQGRVTRELRADNSDRIFTYENTTSRVKETRDAKQQIARLDYFLDDKWKQVTYVNPQQPTANLSFTYDPVHHRLLTITDGTGTTTYGYSPIGSPPGLGAGRLASVDGALPNDLITYDYDELGLVKSLGVNGSVTSLDYDALGRMRRETNPLGSFHYSYEGPTFRLASVSLPNGQSTTYDYLPNLNDRRLQEVHNKLAGGSTLSRFQYTYDAEGAIKSWMQQTDSSPAKVLELSHDAMGRLLAATLKTTDATPTTLKRYRYAYDSQANRTGEQIDDAAMTAVINALDQITEQQPGGALLFAGTVSEPAAVTVQTRPAEVTAENRFTGAAEAGAGTNTVAVMAADPSGNVRTNTYQLSVSGATKMLSYDANGNLTGDGTRTFDWDANDRLVAAVQGTHRSEFSYDGWGHRVRIIEKESGAVTSDRRFLWCGMTICEERDGTGATVVRRYFDQGMQDGATVLFYARDHLGSLRELTDFSGSVRARYDYDPYGRATKVSGDAESLLGFTGHLLHAPSGLTLAPLRAYDPGLGRWLSQDPIGLLGGPNLYGYVGGRPVDFVDPLGLLKGPLKADPIVDALVQQAMRQAIRNPRVILLCVVFCGAVIQKGDGHPPHDPQGSIDGDDPDAGTDADANPKSDEPWECSDSKERKKRCLEQYYKDQSACDLMFSPTPTYDKCEKHAWQNYLRCINGLPPKPFNQAQ